MVKKKRIECYYLLKEFTLLLFSELLSLSIIFLRLKILERVWTIFLIISISNFTNYVIKVNMIVQF